MEKNDFLRINDLIYYLYTEESFNVLKLSFLQRLKLLIDYDYGSILMTKEKDGEMQLASPVCYPENFIDLEKKYLTLNIKDYTNWLLYSDETVIIRESAVINDGKRLTSPVYEKLYSSYDIYDTLQMNICSNGLTLAVITLYKTRNQGTFTEEDAFYLKALGRHLNHVFALHISGHQKFVPEKNDLPELAFQYSLTPRESEILSYVLCGMSNIEILDKISVSSYTLQKHLQNIYRKMNVSSRIELMKFRS